MRGNGTSWYNEHRKARTLLNKTVCEICGSTKNLDIHHKDGNHHNNDISNLQCLCRSCHTKIHHKKSVCYVCGKPAKGHNLCEKHLQRYRKYGDPLLTNRGHNHIVRVED